MITKRFIKHKSGSGFTLIEVVVYLCLFAILMGGMVTAAYSVFESSDHNQAKIMVQEEGNFLVAKIDWALSGGKAAYSPQPRILSVDKYDGSNVVITLDNCSGDITSNIFLKKGTDCFQLNNSNVQVSNLVFTHNSNPENVEAVFTLSTRTLNGTTISQDFFTTKFLRR